MRLAQEIAKAIGHMHSLTVARIDLDSAIKEGRTIYYWHSLNGVSYVRYRLEATNPGTNILVKLKPTKRQDAIVEVGVSSWSYVVVGDRIADTLSSFSEDTCLWLGDEEGDRIRIGVAAELIRISHADSQQ